MNSEKITKVIKPIDPLNIYLNIFDLFKIQNIKLISGDNFVVSDGILRCQNYFIPLESISLVEMARIQLSPWFFIVIFLFGLGLSVFNVYLYNEYYIQITFAVPMFVFGFILSVAIIFLNTKLPYIMTIRLNNNIFCTYMNRNKIFIQKITDKMQECINNRKGEYKFMLNKGIIEYNDNHSINLGNGNSGIDIITSGGKKEINNSNTGTMRKTQNQKSNVSLTAEEWAYLEQFCLMRQREFDVNDQNYKICNNLRIHSQNKDIGKLKKYFISIGQQAIKTIFLGGVNVTTMETIRPIVQKIIAAKA